MARSPVISARTFQVWQLLAGFTHFGIEVPRIFQTQIDEYLGGDEHAPDGVVAGPGHNIKATMETARNQGLEIVALDVEQTAGMGKHERDRHLAENIMEMVLALKHATESTTTLT